MKTSSLFFYIANLVVEGHKWQYKNALGKGKPFKGYFSLSQYIFIVFAISFLFINKDGVSQTTTDLLLNTLGILIGLFLALVVIVYEKFRTIKFDSTDIHKKTNDVKLWNTLSQYNALISYAILIGLLLLFILIGNLFLGRHLNLDDYCFVGFSNLTETNLPLTGWIITTALARIAIVYFVFDFIYISVYAVIVLFQVIRLEMMDKKPQYTEITVEEDKDENEEVKHAVRFIKVFCFLLLVLTFIYLLCIIKYGN